MPRLPRNNLHEGVYHVMNRGIHKLPIFEDEAAKVRFTDSLRRMSQQYGMTIFHWAVMNNHYHLLLDVPVLKKLSRFVSALQVSYAAWHHRYRRQQGEKAAGYLFQGRFRCSLVETENYLLACGRYIERNPVRAGRVRLAWQYTWSSARAYVQGIQDGITATAEHPLLPVRGKKTPAEWKRFLGRSTEAEKEEKLFRSAGRHVGSTEFLSRILYRSGRPTTRHPGKPHGS